MLKTTKLKGILLELVLIRGKIKDADKNGRTKCCTCGLVEYWWLLSGGHFMPQSKGNSTRFELDNVNAQCAGCNGRMNQGEQYKHGLYIDARYGVGRAEQLIAQANKLKKWGIGELEEEIELVSNLIFERYKNQNKTQQENLIKYIIKNSSRKSKLRQTLDKIGISK